MNRSKSIVLLASGFFGDVVLESLAAGGGRPFVASYPLGAFRKGTNFDSQQYSKIFSLFEITSNKFTVAGCPDFPQCDYVVTAGWTKDFFHGAAQPLPFKIYHAHPSLLPLYRGYGAVSDQFLRGVSVSGLSIYEENGSIDGGDIVYQEKIRITHEDTPADFLRNCGNILATFIKNLERGEVFHSFPQSKIGGFYIPRTRNNQKIIDFNAAALSVYNFIRAYSFPYSNASFYWNGEKYEVAAASVESWNGEQGQPSEIINIDDNWAEIACGEGSIIFKEINHNGIKVDLGQLGATKGMLLI